MDSAADFEDLSVVIEAPEGAEDIMYSIINDEIAQVQYTLEGKTFVLRSSQQVEVSALHGIYGDFEEWLTDVVTTDKGATAILETTQIQNAGAVVTATIEQEETMYYLTLTTTDTIQAQELEVMLWDVINALF